MSIVPKGWQLRYNFSTGKSELVPEDWEYKHDIVNNRGSYLPKDFVGVYNFDTEELEYCPPDWVYVGDPNNTKPTYNVKSGFGYKNRDSRIRINEFHERSKIRNKSIDEIYELGYDGSSGELMRRLKKCSDPSEWNFELIIFREELRYKKKKTEERDFKSLSKKLEKVPPELRKKTLKSIRKYQSLSEEEKEEPNPSSPEGLERIRTLLRNYHPEKEKVRYY